MNAPTVDEVADAIRARRYRYASEDELQAGLHAVLAAAGWRVYREVSLDRYSRLDLLVCRDARSEAGIAVEVKTAGTRAELARQVRRYVGYPAVEGLVLVTSRVRHGQLPPTVLGKPVRVVQLALQAL